jgi:serine/threonine protein phosphatase PrpC
MLELDTCYISEIGGRQRNEDACGYWQSATMGCWVLSDGAGGHGSGDLASRLVVSTVLRAFSERPEVSPQQALSLLKAANEAVITEKTSGTTRDDMHATVTILLLDRASHGAVLAHVGDSRIYHFRQARIHSRTSDHSLVQQMVDAGYGGAELLRTHPKRNLLTSAIGAAGAIEMTVSPQPLEVLPGDCFLLCSDGWWEYLEDPEMEQALARQLVVGRWLDEMAATIRSRGRAGHDNYSALCVSIRDDSTVLLDSANVRTVPLLLQS